MPLRIALTGQMKGPDVGELLAVLDLASSEVRIESVPYYNTNRITGAPPADARPAPRTKPKFYCAI